MHVECCLFQYRPIWSSLSEPPAVIVYSNNVSSDTGSLLVISCTVFAIPLPDITWSVTNEYGSTSEVQNTSTTMITTRALTVQNYTYAISYLVICNTTENDSGTYMCSSNNGVNGSSLTATSEEFGVSVRGIISVCSCCYWKCGSKSGGWGAEGAGLETMLQRKKTMTPLTYIA